MARHIFSIVLFLSGLGCAHTGSQVAANPPDCVMHPELQKEQSAELARIEREDQADRAIPFDQIDWVKVSPRDLSRRVEVARIFAAGCFHTADDYNHAALVFQHGDSADHFYQTFTWANQAVKMGDVHERGLVALGIDRYLVAAGHKQLFGTQISMDGAHGGIWCLPQIEPTFPESRRKEFLGHGLKEHIAATIKGNGLKISPGDLVDCKPDLKPSPSGTVPGFW